MPGYKEIRIPLPSPQLGGTILGNSVGKTTLYSFSTAFNALLYSFGYFNNIALRHIRFNMYSIIKILNRVVPKYFNTVFQVCSAKTDLE